MDRKPRRALRPDAQAFDEVRLITVPRYKESELSGDEWRISVKAQYLRKGRVLYEESIAHNMEGAASYLGYKYVLAGEKVGYYGGEENFCDQEGCSQRATTTYQLKKNYCRSGHESDPYGVEVRMFCDKHNQRGNCGLEDADSNYIKLDIGKVN